VIRTTLSRAQARRIRRENLLWLAGIASLLAAAAAVGLM